MNPYVCANLALPHLSDQSPTSPSPPHSALAATFIARLLSKHRWIAYVGLAIILYVALEMMYRGGLEVMPFVQAYLAK